MTAVSWLMHHTVKISGRCPVAAATRFMGSYDHRAYEPAQALQGCTYEQAQALQGCTSWPRSRYDVARSEGDGRK